MRPRTATILMSLLPFVSGCLVHAPRADRLAHRLEKEMPGTHLEHQAQLKLGRLSMALVKGVAGAAVGEDPEERAALAAVRGVKRFELATYEVHGNPEGTLREGWFRERGWKTMIRVRGPQQQVWVLYRERDALLRNLWMVFLDGEELAVIRIDGKLSEMLSAVMSLALSGVEEEEPSDEVAPAAPATPPTPVESANARDLVAG